MNARLLPATSVFLLAFILNVAATTRYVDLSNPSPTPPYTSWPTAATNIQDAIDEAADGDLVLVTNGVYSTGGRPAGGSSLTNRIAVTNQLTVQSVNGPTVTAIVGYQVPGTTNGDSAIRCAYLSTNAILNGFRLTNGATKGSGGFNIVSGTVGGGVCCESTQSLVTNCIVTGNAAAGSGAGIHKGTAISCEISGNKLFRVGGSLNGGGAYASVLIGCNILSNYIAEGFGGGAYNSTLTNCLIIGNYVGGGSDGGGGVFGGELTFCVLRYNYATFVGGGAESSKLTQCTLENNTAELYGGGAAFGTLNKCIIVSNNAYSGGGVYNATATNSLIRNNTAQHQGGGAHSSGLTNCTVVENTVTGITSADRGGGTYQGTIRNSIIYFNSALIGSDTDASSPRYCCFPPPLLSGAGNITNAPLFVDQNNNDYRLQSNSPCINAGTNALAGVTDLDGNPRIVGGTIDIGAYESQSPALLDYYSWLQSYGLPTSASAAYSDSDADGMNNWGEWRSDTIPTNAPSVMRMVVATNSLTGMKVTWQSVTTRAYFLERSTNLGAASSFLPIATNLAGLTGATTYLDTSATNGGPYFYRVGVQ